MLMPNLVRLPTQLGAGVIEPSLSLLVDGDIVIEAAVLSLRPERCRGVDSVLCYPCTHITRGRLELLARLARLARNLSPEREATITIRRRRRTELIMVLGDRAVVLVLRRSRGNTAAVRRLIEVVKRLEGVGSGA